MKPNISIFSLIFSIFSIILFSKNRKEAIKIFLLGGLVAFLILFFFSINPVEVVKTYWSGGISRVSSLEEIQEIFIEKDPWETIPTLFLTSVFIIYFIFFMFHLIATEFKSFKKIIKVKYLIYFIFALLITFIGMATNNDLNLNEVSIMIIFGSLLVLSIKEKFGSNHFVKVYLGILCLLIFYSINWGYSISKERLRIFGEGNKVFFEDVKLQEINQPFFRGLRSTPKFNQIVSEITKVGNLIKTSENKIFFGPRIDFSYAMISTKPAKGLPLWWSKRGEEFWGGVPISFVPNIIADFKRNRFDGAVFLEYDYTFIPDEIRQYLSSNYNYYRVGNLEVYINKKNINLNRKIGSFFRPYKDNAP